MNSYRIGFLNPWRNAAENQAFHSMAIAADRIGHTLVHVATTAEVEAADLHFVIATASTQPKTTDIPTFGAIHEPRERFWQNQDYFDNLLSYDGYLTISDNLVRFLRSLCAGFGRDAPIGRYYNTPQRSNLSCNLYHTASFDLLRLCYFGTNWDKRNRPMFRELSRRPYMRIYGPEQSWSYLTGPSYKGSLPFDGNSVQQEYATFGVGLVALSQGHLLDDIISNRIFEITSAGAVAICPDTPWIRKHFGDSVFYYDARQSTSSVVGAIDKAMAQIVADLAAASDMAARARAIFERDFSAEVMLREAVRTFEHWRDQRVAKRAAATRGAPTVDVIVRCGGRPIDMIMRAVRSIDRQTSGRFRVIFVRYKPIDLSELTGREWHNITECTVVDCFGGNRSATLCAGLRHVHSTYFAVLDDDDYWLADHIEHLWDALRCNDPATAYAHSGTIGFQQVNPTDPAETHRIHNVRPAQGDIWSIMGSFAMNSFLCSSGLLRYLNLDKWELETAEDSVLQATMIAHANVAFTHRATACFQRNSLDSSRFANHMKRAEDEFDCFTRIADLIPAIERKFAQTGLNPWERLGWALDRIHTSRKQAALAGLTAHVLKEGQIADSLHDLAGIVPLILDLAQAEIQAAGATALVEDGREIDIHPPSSAWAYGLQIPLDQFLTQVGAGWLVCEFGPGNIPFGLGILNERGEFAVREECPATTLPLEMWLPFDGASASRLVVQNWAVPMSAPVRLRRLNFVAESALGSL